MYYVVGTLIVLGVAVLVHELGHFILARRNGVRVEEFCIGFPPRIFKITRGGTQYSLGIVPIGGFVKMAGDDPESLSGAPDEFFSKSIWARIRICVAGPATNLVCAYLCVLAYLWTGGLRIPVYEPVFGTAEDQETYQMLAIQPGDKIVEVNGQQPKTFTDMLEQLLMTDSQPARLVIEGVENGAERRREILLDSGHARELAENARPFIQPVIARVMPNGPAERAGLKVEDRVESIDSRSINEWAQLYTAISTSAGETIALGVRRNNQLLSISIVPDAEPIQTMDGQMKKVGRIGVQSAVTSIPRKVGIFEGLKVSLIMLYDFIAQFIEVIWRLLAGSISVKMLAGPVGIAQFAGDSLKQGGHQFLMFLGLINANLGFINLIPFFLITDGGLILLFGIEALRRRKMSVQGLARWNTLGWTMVLALLVVATWNDLVLRLELGEKVSRGINTLKDMF